MKLHTLLLVAVGCALSACGETKQSVGLGESAPGETPVASQVPLSMPPEFNLPVSASSASQGTDSGITPDATQSAGEQALLQTAGASSPNPSIRKTVDQEAAPGAWGSQELMDKLAFWENSALQPATTSAAPTIKRKTKNLLEGIF